MVNGIGECGKERANASQLYRSSKTHCCSDYCIILRDCNNNYYLYQLLILCHRPTNNSRFHYLVLSIKRGLFELYADCFSKKLCKTSRLNCF